MRFPIFAPALLLLSLASAHADVLDLPTAAESSPMDKPAKGATMQAVLARHGAPTKKHAAVGGGSPQQPPITRWDYPGFSVFFEHDHVVDAVVPGRPPTLQRTDEWQ